MILGVYEIAEIEGMIDYPREKSLSDLMASVDRFELLKSRSLEGNRETSIDGLDVEIVNVCLSGTISTWSENVNVKLRRSVNLRNEDL